ncbi:autotransporter beta-domain protein [Chlamydia ibidis]|uniref:Autotransporter beta-domain protein n=3 Tax=Chlamydia ibidis TaxID=1405396 RepID=S7KLR2_9CHLA|nr:autotransporter beta-domain protein [Chlamydia ibidis]EQM63189.1 autotransporter beta-domain protein [Chlamydia ibidis 10-1398/6]
MFSDNSSVMFSGNSSKAHSALTAALHTGSKESAATLQSDGGAVQSTGTLGICNNKNVCFSSNFSTNKGGAISSGSSVIEGNRRSVKFQGNFSADCGGALYSSGSCNIINNIGIVTFTNNTAASTESVAVLATEPTPMHSGGAISCNALTIEGNKGPVIFQSNQSSGSGGAVHATTNLTVQNNGPVSFLNNQSAQSGAISVGTPTAKTVKLNGTSPATSTITLFADYGNIVFDGNVIVSNGTGKEKKSPVVTPERSAFLTTNGTSVQVGARKGYKVSFYDPFTHGSTTQTLTINPNPEHQGTVLLSAANLDWTQYLVKKSSPSPSDMTTTCSGPAELCRGILCIRDGAIFSATKFTQSGGTVLLGNGGKITTTIPAATSPSELNAETNPQIALTCLGIDIDSLTQSLGVPTIEVTQAPAEAAAAALAEKTGTAKAITITSLQLLNSDGNSPYEESPLLAKSFTDMTLLNLTEPTASSPGVGGLAPGVGGALPHTKHSDSENQKLSPVYMQGGTSLQSVSVTLTNIDTSGLSANSLNSQQHYGYQGTWTTEIAESTSGADGARAGGNTKILKASWTPTHYVVNPENTGYIVPNILSQTAFETKAFLSSMDSMFGKGGGKSSGRKIDGQVSGLFIHHGKSKDPKGYHSKTLRYVIGESLEQFNDLTLNFSQTFGHTYENCSQNKVMSHGYLVGLHLRLPRVHQSMHTKGALSYGYFTHHMTSLYPTLLGSSEGRFHGTSWGASMSFYFTGQLPVYFFHSFTHMSPFVQIVGLRSSQPIFEETGDHRRKFKVNKRLYHVAIPVGIEGQNTWHFLKNPAITEARIAYHPVVLKKSIEAQGIMLSNQGSWSVKGAHLTRHAVSVSVKTLTSLSKHLQIAAEYQGEFSNLLRYQNVQLNTKLVF